MLIFIQTVEIWLNLLKISQFNLVRTIWHIVLNVSLGVKETKLGASVVVSLRYGANAGSRLLHAMCDVGDSASHAAVVDVVDVVVAGVVPEQARQVPQAGEAAAEGAGPLRAAGLQRHDEEPVPAGRSLRPGAVELSRFLSLHFNRN